MATEVLFSDLKISFKAHPVTGDLYLVKGKDAITQSIKNLVLTNKFEVLFNPDCFSNVTYTLFENPDSADLVILKNGIENILENYESRCHLIDIKYQEDLDNNGFYLEIVYLPLNSTQLETIEVFLERLR